MRPSKALSEFSQWKINLAHYSLINKKDEIFVEPRLLKLLNFLCENENAVVTRGELIDHVWGDIVVTEESLSKAIFDLRKFLTENFKDAPQIITIRKVGYKLELKEKVATKHSSRFLRLALRVVIYVFILVSILSIIVRAIRYEN